MRVASDLYQINGKPMLAPDAGVEMSFQDLESRDSGRDESGFLHRIVMHNKAGVWGFTYSHLSREEYSYMLSILPEEGHFIFTHPVLSDNTKSETTTAYLAGYNITWQSARTGEYRDLKFSIIEC